MIRSTAELFAEADRQQQATPAKEPWQLKLRNGTVVTFRHPEDAPYTEPGAGLRVQLFSLIADPQQQREFWEEWSKQKSHRLAVLLNAIVDYYTAEEGDEEGKDGSASTSTATATTSSATSP